MLGAAKLAAVFELEHKTYERRTGDLDRGTKGSMVTNSANDITVEFIMNTDYASYLRDRGFTAFDEAGIAARDTIQDFIDGMTE